MHVGWEGALIGVGHTTHQEARRVVQEAAEAAHEAPLQEGRVLRRKMLGAVGEQRGAAVCFHLCKQEQDPLSTATARQATSVTSIECLLEKHGTD